MKKLAVVLILFSTSMVFAQYNEALKLYQEGKYNEALKICAQDLDVSKDFEKGSPNYNIRFLAAHIHWKLGNGDSVVSHLRRCADIRKNAVEPYVDMALFFLSRKNLNAASATAYQGLNIKQDAMLYYVLGEVALKQHNYVKAKATFEKANVLNQEISLSYNGLGTALMKLGRYSEANTAFTIASAIAPESTEILNNLAMSYAKSGKNKIAIKILSRASEMDPDNTTIKNNLKRITRQN